MFEILRMGCSYPHNEDFLIERECGYDCFLALFIQSPCVIGVNGKKEHFKANTFILYNKKSYQLYGADLAKYIDDWIQFDCEEQFISGLNFGFDTPVSIGETVKLHSYFQLICDAYFRCINNSAVTDYLIKAMLADISNGIENSHGGSPHYRDLLKLRRDIYSNPHLSWSVDSMAKQLHVSKPYIQELYHSTFGRTCISDVIESRIVYAKSLLSYSDLSIEEIAYSCGYSGAIHFSRQFRQLIGMPPSMYRAKSKL